MRIKIEITKVSEDVNMWSFMNNGKEFSWKFSKEMPLKDCKINSKEFSSIFESQLKTMEKLVAIFMFERRFANTTACLYTNIKAAEKLGVTRKTMGKALKGLVNAGVLGRVKKSCGDFYGYQYYIKEKESWNLPVKKKEVLVVELG